MPTMYRWEFTRRHPYYQLFWNSHNEMEEYGEEVAALYRKSAELILAAINVSHETIAPETEWPELASDEGPKHWNNGTLRRIRLMGLVQTLIGTQPKVTLAAIAELLRQAAALEESDTAGLYNLAHSVVHGNHPGFDAYLPELIVTLFPSGSEKAIARDLNQIVRNFRHEHNIEPTRTRTDKYDDYLRVWDLREGWSTGCYDRQREQSLREVSRETGASDSTVFCQYKSAFQLITGREYSPEMWFHIVGYFKMLELLGDGTGPLSRRGGRTTSVGAISESGLSIDTKFRLIESTFPSNEPDPGEVAMKRELIDAVRSDATVDEIINRFDLDSSARQFIVGFRDHLRP